MKKLERKTVWIFKVYAGRWSIVTWDGFVQPTKEQQYKMIRHDFQIMDVIVHVWFGRNVGFMAVESFINDAFGGKNEKGK